MQISNNGVALIKGFEGLRLKAYLDVAGHYTIGYGETYYGGRPVKQGDSLDSEAEADAMLRRSLVPYEASVTQYVHVPLTQNQFDALVSFTYNEGPGALAMSSLLKFINLKEYADASGQFAAWNKVTDPSTGEKIVNSDLVERRAKEAELFNQPE